MDFVDIKSPLEKTLFWVLLITASSAFGDAFSLLFYDPYSDGHTIYWIMKLACSFIFIFKFVNLVNRKIILKYGYKKEDEK